MHVSSVYVGVIEFIIIYVYILNLFRTVMYPNVHIVSVIIKQHLNIHTGEQCSRHTKYINSTTRTCDHR